MIYFIFRHSPILLDSPACWMMASTTATSTTCWQVSRGHMIVNALCYDTAMTSCIHQCHSLELSVFIWRTNVGLKVFVTLVLPASGLSSVQGFTEMTNEWACLGYGLATCKDKPAEMWWCDDDVVALDLDRCYPPQLDLYIPASHKKKKRKSQYKKNCNLILFMCLYWRTNVNSYAGS